MTFDIKSDCGKVSMVGADLKAADAFEEVTAEWDGAIFSTVRKHLGGCCTGCVVPSALFKSMQVAVKFALPVEVGYQLEAG